MMVTGKVLDWRTDRTARCNNVARLGAAIVAMIVLTQGDTSFFTVCSRDGNDEIR
jgi:hypothetical protein